MIAKLRDNKKVLILVCHFSDKAKEGGGNRETVFDRGVGKRKTREHKRAYFHLLGLPVGGALTIIPAASPVRFSNLCHSSSRRDDDNTR